MRQLEPVWTLDLRPCGGQWCYAADLNGDGAPEILTIQSAGMLDSGIYAKGIWKERGWIDKPDQDLLCITALDLRGRILWQNGTPWSAGRPWRTHGGTYQVCLHDFDGDGRAEVVYVHKDRMVMLDGATGRVRREARLERDNYALILPVNLDGHPHSRALLVKVQDAPYPPYTYSNPVIVLDDDFKVRWPAKGYIGAGHDPHALDVDGDGREEIVVGYNLVDHDGAIRWTLDITNPDEHCDECAIGDVDGDGRQEIAYAGSKDAILGDLEGGIRWRCTHGHIQHVRFVGGRVVFSEKWAGLVAYDPAGAKLWEDAEGTVSFVIPAAGGSGEDLMLYRKGEGEPVLVDRDLRPRAAFADASRIAGRADAPKADRYAAADFGNVLHSLLLEDPKTGRQLVLYNRQEMRAYEV